LIGFVQAATIDKALPARNDAFLMGMLGLRMRVRAGAKRMKLAHV
jgi:hypothetical protein